MEMRGLSDLGPAHPQAQKQSGKKRYLKDFRGGPAVGTQSFQCPGLGSIPGGGGDLRPYKLLRAAPPQKKRWLQKPRWGAGGIQAKLDAPAAPKQPPPPDFHAEHHFLNLGSNSDEEVYLGRLPHSSPPIPTPGTTADQSGLSDGEDNLPERGGWDLRNNLFHQREEASVNNQSVPQV